MVDFEGKKDAVQVFNNLLRRQIGTRTPTVEYICTKVNLIVYVYLGFVRYVALDNSTYLMLIVYIPHFNVYSQR